MKDECISDESIKSRHAARFVLHRCAVTLSRVGFALALLYPSCLGQHSGVSAPTALPQTPSSLVSQATTLALVDILAQDTKTSLPLKGLKQDDFRIFDNRREVLISKFDSGANFSTRSLAVWFVVICNERGRGPSGQLASGRFAGKESLFRPALNDLDKPDRVGVAHWCDEGSAKIDLQPSTDRDAAIATLQQALGPIAYEGAPSGRTRDGELTLQRLIRLIVDNDRSNRKSMPVLVFLHSDHTGMPPVELDQLVDDLLRVSGIVYGIKDADVDEPRHGFFLNTERSAVLHYMAQETGGSYFSVRPQFYATALQTIFQMLHFRYQVGFTPVQKDGKRHELKIELVGSARKDNKSVRLDYYPEYIPNSN